MQHPKYNVARQYTKMQTMIVYGSNHELEQKVGSPDDTVNLKRRKKNETQSEKQSWHTK